MGTLDRARKAIKRITSNQNGFGVELKFFAPTGEEATITGLHTVINWDVDMEGNQIASKKAMIAFYEGLLADAGYPVRLNNEVNLVKHKVHAKDSAGILRKYIMKIFFPDESTGLITCNLDELE